jgi:outer membrane murein-binding lipoprotein Lpp
MNQEFSKRILMAMILPVLLLIGCADDKAPTKVEERPKAARLFDTQRSALEQAKETADSATLRNLQFEQRAKKID